MGVRFAAQVARVPVALVCRGLFWLGAIVALLRRRFCRGRRVRRCVIISISP